MTKRECFTFPLTWCIFLLWKWERVLAHPIWNLPEMDFGQHFSPEIQFIPEALSLESFNTDYWVFGKFMIFSIFERFSVPVIWMDLMKLVLTECKRLPCYKSCLVVWEEVQCWGCWAWWVWLSCCSSYPSTLSLTTSLHTKYQAVTRERNHCWVKIIVTPLFIFKIYLSLKVDWLTMWGGELLEEERWVCLINTWKNLQWDLGNDCPR